MGVSLGGVRYRAPYTAKKGDGFQSRQFSFEYFPEFAQCCEAAPNPRLCGELRKPTTFHPHFSFSQVVLSARFHCFQTLNLTIRDPLLAERVFIPRMYHFLETKSIQMSHSVPDISNLSQVPCHPLCGEISAGSIANADQHPRMEVPPNYQAPDARELGPNLILLGKTNQHPTCISVSVSAFNCKHNGQCYYEHLKLSSAL